VVLAAPGELTLIFGQRVWQSSENEIPWDSNDVGSEKRD